MSRRDLSQPSFVDAMVSGYGKVGGFLDRIEQGSTGRRSRLCFRRSTARRWARRPVTMFKIVLLQQWHTLSDPGAEEAVRQAEMTPANVHDSRLGEALIQGDEQGYFADRAYDSQALRETLEARGLVDGIAWKVKHPRYPLETWQKLHISWVGSVRSAVERAFATMKRWYGMGPSAIWDAPATPAICSSSRWR
jgi:Transposase DDE domain